MMKKRGIALLILLAGISLLSAAYAGTSTTGGNTTTVNSGMSDRLLNVPSFKFRIHEDGIGYGNCPVYTAPTEDSFRCANGKASVWTNEEMCEAGFVSGWLLVRYETNNGGCRVGYIPPNKVKGFKSGMSTPKFDYIPVTALDTIMVTDNPMLPGSSFARLDPDEVFYVLGKYTYHGDWWYIECTVDNKVARGFIDRETSCFTVDGVVVGQGQQGSSAQSSGAELLGIPSISPLGTEYIDDVYIGYGTTGERKAVRKNADPNSERLTSVYPGNRYPCYASKMGTTGKTWYYIWVEEDSTWGWVSSGYAELGK